MALTDIKVKTAKPKVSWPPEIPDSRCILK